MAEVPWNLAFDDIAKCCEALKRKKTKADCIRSMTESSRREQCRKIQRALIDYYIDRPRLRDELYSACTMAFEALIEKEKKNNAKSK